MRCAGQGWCVERGSQVFDRLVMMTDHPSRGVSCPRPRISRCAVQGAFSQAGGLGGIPAREHPGSPPPALPRRAGASQAAPAPYDHPTLDSGSSTSTQSLIEPYGPPSAASPGREGDEPGGWKVEKRGGFVKCRRRQESISNLICQCRSGGRCPRCVPCARSSALRAAALPSPDTSTGALGGRAGARGAPAARARHGHRSHVGRG